MQNSVFPIEIGFQNKENKSNLFSFDGGLKLGYQHYFNKEALGIKQAYGLSFGAYIGAGVPLSGELSIKQKAETNFSDGVYIFKSKFLPIKAGFDLNFLWDFLEKENHTLGLTAGLGYRLSYYKSTENNFNALIQGEGGSTQSKKFSDLMIHNFYPQIGLHYYYENHQFSLDYRFGGLITYGSKVNKENCFDALGAGAENYVINTQILETSYISFGYSYRF